MPTLQGRIAGPLVVDRDLDIHGTIVGDATVRPGHTPHLRGAITGNLTIQKGATAIIYGTVEGHIRKIGGTVVIVHPPAQAQAQSHTRASGRDDPSNSASSSIDSC
jgi:hypothetical protein